MGYFKSVNRKKRRQKKVTFIMVIIFILLLFIYLCKTKMQIKKDYLTKLVYGYLWLETTVEKTKNDTKRYAYSKINASYLPHNVTFASNILKVQK